MRPMKACASRDSFAAIDKVSELENSAALPFEVDLINRDLQRRYIQRHWGN